LLMLRGRVCGRLCFFFLLWLHTPALLVALLTIRVVLLVCISGQHVIQQNTMQRDLPNPQHAAGITVEAHSCSGMVQGTYKPCSVVVVFVAAAWLHTQWMDWRLTRCRYDVTQALVLRSPQDGFCLLAAFELALMPHRTCALHWMAAPEDSLALHVTTLT